jgi:hypothetical protein
MQSLSGDFPQLGHVISKNDMSAMQALSLLEWKPVTGRRLHIRWSSWTGQQQCGEGQVAIKQPNPANVTTSELYVNDHV